MNIQDKIKKLLALGERAGTEAEGMAAMAAAHAILARHNLTMADIQAHSPDAEKVEGDDGLIAPSRAFDWQELIYPAIAELYFCEFLITLANRKRGTPRKYTVVGKPGNIAVVKYLAQYLIRSGDKLATSSAIARADDTQAGATAAEMQKWVSSFRMGYAARINARAAREIAAAKADKMADETGTALVLSPLYSSSKAANAAFIAAEFGRVSHRKKSIEPASGEGYRAGQEAGEAVSLKGDGIRHDGTRQLAIGR
jgi:Protein of unknown function (DUF2786)